MRYMLVAAAIVASLTASGAMAADAKLGRVAAECAVDQDHGSVAALLQTLPGSPDEEKAARRIAPVFEACGAELAISPWSQALGNGRADLAAAAAQRELAKGSTPSSDAITPWYASAIARRTLGDGYDAVSLGMQEFGTCVVGAAGSATAQLVGSAAGSAEERAAIAAIKPVLAGCVVQGKPLHMTLDQLRLMVAEPLYHVIAGGRS